MPRRSAPLASDASGRGRRARRISGLAAVAVVVVAVAGVRRVVLDRDQRAFEQRYGARSPDAR